MRQSGAVDVLLVEDNAQDAELAIRVLRKHSLADRLLWLEDGVQAVDFLFARGKYAGRTLAPPRVVLLDLKLPKVDGFEVLRAIKADERTRAIPVVILTSSNQDCDIRQAYALGANGYTVKSVDFDAFHEGVGALARYWLKVNHPAL